MKELNTVVQDHRNLHEWSLACSSVLESEIKNHPDCLPIDMRFNDGHRLSIIVYSILMVISSIGNFTVLIFLIKRRRKSPARIEAMLVHLAIADLLVTFLMMPLEIGWAWTVSWHAGDIVCRIMAFFRTFGLYLSSFILVCISIDRYLAVLKPMYISGIDKRGKVMIFISWMAAALCSLPQAIIFHVETHPTVKWYDQCVTYNFFSEPMYDVVYSFLVMIFMYTLPFLIIIFTYASIYIEIFKRSRPGTNSDFYCRRSSLQILGRAKRRTLQMTITIVSVFVICWTPFYIMSMWYWFDPSTANMVDQRIQKGLFLFACTNSCMNPIVYGLFNIRKRQTRNISLMQQSSTKKSQEFIKTDSRRTILSEINTGN